MKCKAIIIGPQAPAIGGIATIVELLKGCLINSSNAKFINTIKPENRFGKVIRPINILIRIFLIAMSCRGGRALMFCSSYGSFWEKCVWSLLLKMLGLRTIVYMVAGDFPTFFNELSSFKKALARLFVRNIDVIGTQSPHWKAFYSETFSNSKVQILNPGIDTEFFQPAAKFPSETPKLLYMGWLIREKGIYDLLDSLSIVVGRKPNFKADIVGPDFGAKENITDYARKVGVYDHINLVGGLTDKQEVLNYYQSADIFVFPSHFEGFPYSVMEAVSSGLPCIATNVGGIPDILNSGKCGLLVKPKCANELACSIELLLSDSELRNNLGIQGRAHAIKNYSIFRSLNDFTEILGLKTLEKLS